ncbi:gas vesicle protein GvpO [Streptomyces tsukubensis]|uniref:Gas vesicle protein n=1 Tax=Streptomyces tsukubensis TaxID=83656 RepID=A0A1V4AG48_9ACTN|nr:gas vesicle protein GvpO [Streptomyces tsukubensis]OON82667.1 gas vesicle protein [Streptomyces tsukubensis]QFR92164.1 gas vesicle protein [Streptomyces tsukubensis]
MAEERTTTRTRPSPKSAGSARERGGPRAAIKQAREWLDDLVEHRVEAVSAVRPTDKGGWLVCVEVLEVPRIPDTTSLLATYEVTLDPSGELSEYRRVRRYRRGAADE